MATPINNPAVGDAPNDTSERDQARRLASFEFESVPF